MPNLIHQFLQGGPEPQPAAKADLVHPGMTRKQVEDVLGRGWIAPTEGVGYIRWYFSDGRELMLLPHYLGNREDIPRIRWERAVSPRRLLPPAIPAKPTLEFISQLPAKATFDDVKNITGPLGRGRIVIKAVQFLCPLDDGSMLRFRILPQAGYPLEMVVREDAAHNVKQLYPKSP